MDSAGRPAQVADVHALALAMPHVTRVDGPLGNPVCQVGGESSARRAAAWLKSRGR